MLERLGLYMKKALVNLVNISKSYDGQLILDD